MSRAQQYAEWIVNNADKKGTPEFETVANAYQLARQEQPEAPTDMRAGRGTNRAEDVNVAPQESPSTLDYLKSQGASLGAGMYDPIAGTEQLALSSRNITPVARMLQLVDAGVSSLTGEQGGQQGALTRQTQRDQSVEQLREKAGRGGWDITRLAGNIANPINLYMGRGMPTGPIRKKVAGGVGVGTLAGASAPLSGEASDFIEEKMFQAGFGGIVGGAVPFSIEGAKGLYKIIRNLPISNANKTKALQEYILDKAGDDVDNVIRALREVDELVPGSRPTTADALADQPQAVGLIKEQQRVAGLESQAPRFIQRDIDRQSARMGELSRTLGDEADIKALQDLRRETTASLREQALEQANVFGRAAGEGTTPSATRALGFKQAAESIGDAADKQKAATVFKQAQLQSLKNEGFYPLETKPLMDAIDRSLKTPGERSNSLLVNAQTNLRTKLDALTDDNGVIDSRDLYNIRKEIADDIQQFTLARSGNVSMSVEAGNVEKALKGQLDEAIVKASGSTAWKDYLKNYATYSQKIDQRRVGQELKKKLGEGSLGDVEKAGTFALAVQNAPQLIKRTTGAPRYNNLDDFLTTEQTSSVNRVLADLSRTKKADDMAKKIARENPEMLQGLRDVNFLDQRITAMKGVFDKMRRGSQKEFDAKIAEMMANPQQLGLFIEAIPKKEIPNVTAAMAAKMTPPTREAFLQMMGTASMAGTVTQSVRD